MSTLLEEPEKVETKANHRILYVLPVPRFFAQSSGIGGHVAHFYGMIRGFKDAGYRLTIVTAERPAYLDESCCQVHPLPLDFYPVLQRQVWNWRMVQQSAHYAVTWRPQLCYTRYSAGFALFVTRLKRALSDVPLVLETNSIASQQHPWMRWIEKRALQAADVIVCVSDSLKQLILDTLDSSLDRKILVLPNGVDVARFAQAEPVRPWSRHPGTQLGYAGSLKPGYGLELLLDAFAKLCQQRSDVTLHIFGEGPYRQALQRRARILDRVLFHGPVPFHQMPGILKGLDILLNTASSKNTYQSPIKLYEYMAAGKPIISALTPQVKMLLGDEARGLTFPIGDADALVRRIVELIDNPDSAATLAANALQTVRCNHSWKGRVTLLLDELKRRGMLDD